MVMSLSLFARAEVQSSGSKKMDLTKYHSIGNIWLRVSNYGFFGSGDDIQPQWPSLEYPGGSGIDYLYQGSLWFGAKKYRRDAAGNQYYWVTYPPTADNHEVTTNPDTLTGEIVAVIDTLVTTGFDGDKDLYEFLPAYNPLESKNDDVPYGLEQATDVVATASIRENRRGVDDDGDGQIDEDPVGFSFPFRDASELPSQFLQGDSQMGSGYLDDFLPGGTEQALIEQYINIWFPLGFVDLSQNGEDHDVNFNFSRPKDDDEDGLIDEDGYPVSEQDYIGYYYDYSPFGTQGERESGGSASSNTHVPLNVKVRQMSYQWSFGYIKNLVYIEFNVTNMNRFDILYDCTMGIYMDADVGPQAWESSERAEDDISSYDTELNFAYTYDKDKDGGLTSGYIGARVCTPNPDSLEYACWTWKVGKGPDDFNPLDFPTGNTSNEKYWLLSGKNPNPTDYISLRDNPTQQSDQNPDGVDTRFLFAFYGKNNPDENGVTNPEDPEVWNLDPGKTMKIVIAVFPGESVQELQGTAKWARDIYGEAQTLTTVVLPDTFPHYSPPEPPANPKMYAEMIRDGKAFDIYWDNRSEFADDESVIADEFVGWQDEDSSLNSHISNYDASEFPEEYSPEIFNEGEYIEAAKVNPWVASRLRHDFQGYKLWSRSGNGNSEYWDLNHEWAKKESDLDFQDYECNYGSSSDDYYGGYIENDEGLPGYTFVDENNNVVTTNMFDDLTESDKEEWRNYYQYDENYVLSKISDLESNDNLEIAGHLLYSLFATSIDQQLTVSDYPNLPSYLDNKTILQISEFITNPNNAEIVRNLTFVEEALWFKHKDVSDAVYLELYDDKLIPLPEHGGQSALEDADAFDALAKSRLARRFYKTQINNPPRGFEFYIAINTFDRGLPNNEILYLESGRDENMKVFFPGTLAKDKLDDIYVVPNPYVGLSKFDGRKSGDSKGDKSRRIWFANLPKKCTIKVFTLAGDLVDTIEHNGSTSQEILTISKAAEQGIQASGIEPWDLLSRNNQIIASGVYLFSVKDEDGNIKVGKFVIIK
jgi:hypothetical protein